MSDTDKVVDFENPPVVEVVFGAMFAPLRRLQSAHLGRLWAAWSAELPTAHDVPPLPPIMEDLDGSAQVTLAMSNLPELPRVWLMSDDNRTLVQVQRDRLHVNRRRLTDDDPYEGFEIAQPRFESYWSKFAEFSSTTFEERPLPAQLELTYVNVIPACAVFQGLGDVAAVFPDFAWSAGRHAYLGSPELLEWTTSFRLPENLGRLHVVIRASTPRRGTPVVFNMESTARGRAADSTPEGRLAWFQTARRAIDLAFIDLTSKRMQTEIWKRKR